MVTFEDRIESSEFVKTLLKRTIKIYSDHLGLYTTPETRPSVPFEEYGANSSEKKLKIIFRRYQIVSDHFKKIELCKKLISSETALDYCIENNITEIEYYQYHYETFVTTTISLLDLLAGLGNEVYNLGLKKTKCNPTNFNKFSKSKSRKSALILKSFEKYLSQLKKERNIIIHSGGYESEKIESINSKIINNELIQMDSILLDWFSQQKKEKIELLADSIDTAINKYSEFVLCFFESMNEELKKI
ncbi:Cthe_2314 family HEPN domain-containing protein [uncultured Bacteroides sp.]|uniref:Cthe_2314 family HEPN domain-containing protein n=1 Tax=uncultured Bacteroides sp. TaxID=162156 RepID=UPI002AABF393|nr:Cthe_2314 family HEPN domain-containing protein [uncultured Bacteroides sp.]